MKRYILKFKSRFFFTVFLKMISSALWVYTAIVIQNLVDTAVKGNLEEFSKATVVAIVYFLSFVVILFISDFAKTCYIKNTIQYLKSQMFEDIIYKNYRCFKERVSTDYISALTNDINLLEKNYIEPIIELTGEVITFVVTLYVLVQISIPITVVLIFTGLIMLLVPYLFNNSINSKQICLSENTSLFTSVLKDLFDGFEIIKSYSMEQVSKKEFEASNIELEKARQKFNIFIALTGAISLLLSLVCQFSGVILAGYFVLKGILSIGVLTAVMQLGNGIFGPIQKIVKYFTLIKGSAQINKKLLNMLGENEKTETNITEFHDSIELRDISFSYTQDENFALEHISLTLEKDKKYAVLGESGSGKSTLAKILVNYYTDYTGEIYVDHHKINPQKDYSLMTLSSMIHQNVYMFNKSIKENIVLGNTFPEETLQKVILDSGLYKFIDSKGINYQVGENGSCLSGGQKQRIAIARALIQQRPILILDEATSALDTGTSFEIENTILNMQGITVLTITHNINAEILRRYDEIIIMENGKILQRGKYDELNIEIEKYGNEEKDTCSP